MGICALLHRGVEPPSRDRLRYARRQKILLAGAEKNLTGRNRSLSCVWLMIRECEKRASQLTTRPNVRANQRSDPDHLEVDGTSPDWGTLCRLRLIERARLAAELVSRVRRQCAARMCYSELNLLGVCLGIWPPSRYPSHKDIEVWC
jgi:hypothetical protein